MPFREPFRDRLAAATGLPERMLPASYQIIGTVLLLKLLNIRSLEKKKKVAQALLTLFPYVKTVCEIRGIKKEFRTPAIRKLAGNGTVTTHKESGIFYRLDAAKIMFSKGNHTERQRLISSAKDGETVVDMFAGIGYFCIPIAKHAAARIYAIEKNPMAFGYLRENIRLNSVRIEPLLGDNRDYAERLAGTADRVIMGYFPGTEQFLPHALRMLKAKGTIHFHNTYREQDLWKKPLGQLRAACAAADARIRIRFKKIVKSAGPHLEHAVLDAEIRK